MADTWGNIYRFVLGKELKKTGKNISSKKTYDPTGESVISPGEDKQDLPGNEQNLSITPSTDKKPYDPTTTNEQPGAASESSDGPGFIPNIDIAPAPTLKQKKNESPGKMDYSALKLLSGNPQNDINAQINQELQDFMVYASKFPSSVGMPYIQQAMNIASLNYKAPEQEGNIVEKDGFAARMVFDPSNGKTKFTKITGDDGKPIKYFDLFPDKKIERDIKEKSLKPAMTPVRIPGTDGVDKLGFMNMDDYQIKETDVNWEDYNTNPLNYDKLQQQMELVQLKLDAKETKKSSKKGDRTGVESKQVPALLYNGKVVTYQNASDYGIPPDIVKNYYSGNQKLMKKAMNQLSPYGNKISYQSQTQQPGNNPPGPNSNFNPEDWKNLFYTQYNRAKNTADPLYQQAVEWLKNQANINYAKQLGIVK